MSSPSIDTMLGIINNSTQSANIIDNQRALADSIKNSMERNTQNIGSIISNDGDKILNALERNNSFANQNLNAIGSSLKDIMQHGFNADLTAIERTGAAGISATDRVGNSLSSAIERNGSMNMNTTERTAAANAVMAERIGGQLATLSERNNREIMSGFKETAVTNERNFGETRLFNSTQHQAIERKIGEFYLQSERNFGKIETDISRVENSIGRLIDNHHNSAMMEMLKMHTALDKSIANSELNITKQNADNYANIQIEAAKNKMALEQKIGETSADIKLSTLKDNNDTRNLINSYNNDNLRNDLQTEKIIHSLHHHYPYHHHHHDRHHHDGHHGGHHHYYGGYPPFFRGGGDDGGRGGGRGGGD